MQEEVEGRNVSTVTICFSWETPVDIDRSLDGYTRGNFRSHSREAVVHAGMDNFHRRLVAGIAVTAAHVSATLTVNRDKKREISLAVRSKDRKYRADIMAALIVEYIISKEKTTQQVSFANEQVDTMKDINIPQTFLSKSRHYSMKVEELSDRWGLSISQAVLTLKEMT